MANTATYGRTSYFHVIPEKVEEFRAWTAHLDTASRLATDAEGRFALLDVDELRYDEEAMLEHELATDVEDAFGDLMERFVANGQIVFLTVAAYTGMRFVGGYAICHRKLQDGTVTDEEGMDTHIWCDDMRKQHSDLAGTLAVN